MRVPPDCAQVAPLVRGRPPAVGRRQPPLRLTGDLVTELLQALRVGRVRRPHDEGHSTTTPSPPRRGSPAAASAPPSRIVTAPAPPKKRLRARQRTTFQPS